MESGYWELLPIVVRQGCDLNRPLDISWWSDNQQRRCRYLSTLDYFLEFVLVEIDERWEKSSSGPHYRFLGEMDKVLSYGLDVHRIKHSVVFEYLALSLMRNLVKHYNRNDAYFPEIQSSITPFLNELKAIDSLIRHGYSQFQWMRGFRPGINWVGLLTHVVTHPGINKFSLEEAGRALPQLIQSAARLLVNFLCLQHHLPADALEEYAETTGGELQLFRHNPVVASRQMARLMEECTSFLKSPPSLSLLARNKVRECLGGVDFQKKAVSLQLPQWLEEFVICVGPQHMDWVGAPPYLVSVSRGCLTPTQIIDVSGLTNGGEVINEPPLEDFQLF